jgi:aldehyde:ferredoxin oxidoreductase
VKQNLSHTVWECKYHIVWAPKKRRKIVSGKLRKESVPPPLPVVLTTVGLFNLTAGLTRDLDTLPSRYLEEPLNGRACNGRTADIDQNIGEYYFVRGWVDEGKPTKEKTKEFGIYRGQ